MNVANRERVKELLSLASRLPRQERAAFIEHAAGADLQTAAEALDLLGTLDDPAFLIAPTGAGLAAALSQAAKLGEGPGTLIDRYKLLQLIGEGGFGSVFMAEQTEPVHRRVALKIIKAGMDTKQVIARFEAERQALAMMDHPNIARVLDAGATSGGRPYFVMELVRGERVTKYCDRERLPIRQRLGLFRDVCHAVQHAHQKGIIHRDLKPSNILVTVSDGEPLPKVIDFGIAKATAARLTEKTLFTELHQLMGTPEYMSPEQAEVSGVDIDTRSDIYSLGVLLYELLAGSTPLDRSRVHSTPFAEIQRIIREEEPLRPSVRLATLASSGRVRPNPQSDPDSPESSDFDSSAMEVARRRHSDPPLLARTLRGDLDWIVMKCLEKDRRRRYATASALADDIELYLTNQPVSAIPPSAGYKLRKFVRRNRTAVLAGTVTAAVLVLGVIGTTLGLVWAVQERRQAHEQKSIAQASAAVARTEAERADREAEQARAVNEFMREMLVSAAPHKMGADIRLLDVLASASASASHRFAGLPLQEAQVRDLLGHVYVELSLFPEAKAEIGKAMALWRGQLGPDARQTLISESGYVMTALCLNQRYEAEATLSELLPRMENVLGPDDPKTLSARVSSALVDLHRGRVDEAETALLELRAHPRIVDDDEVQVRILRGLFLVLRWRTDGLDRAQSGVLLRQAEPLAREWHERAVRRFGPGGMATLQAELYLAEIAHKVGEYQSAVATLRAFLEKTAERLGECHELRSGAEMELAEALPFLGEVDEPAELFLHALGCFRKKDSATSFRFVITASSALRYVERARRAAEGEALARELLSAMQTFAGAHGDMALGPELYLARFISMQNRLEEAEAIFRDLRARAEVDGRFSQARWHLFYAGQHLRRRQFMAAEEELNKAVALTGDVRKGTYQTHPDDLVCGFIELYEAWGKPGQAEEYRRLRGQAPGPVVRP